MAWLGPIGASLLLYGMGLMGYALSVDWFPDDRLNVTDPAGLVWPIIVLLACLILGYVADLNEITLHRFYRDRLMEAFMPDDDFVNLGRTAGRGRKASDADPSRLHEMCDAADPKGPYHLINTHLVLTVSLPKTLSMTRGGRRIRT